MSSKVLVMTGDGINCEKETAWAFERVGFHAHILHINDVLTLDHLHDYSVLAFPGGFSFGDEIQSGKILALKVRQKLLTHIHQFISSIFKLKEY